MVDSKTPFLFLHVPKTGGVTFHNIISNQFRFKKQFLYKMKTRIKWDSLRDEEKKDYKVVKGHFSFAGKDFYPGNCNYFTFLRDPEKRLISHYRHILETRAHRLHKKLIERKITLKQFLKSDDAPFFDNCFVRFISGNVQKGYGEINENDLELAIQNFDTYFEHFGILEKYDESLLILSYELGWKTPYYVSMNENKSKNKVILDDETEQLIDRYTKYDKILYEFAVRKFSLKTEKYKNVLEADLKKFKEENAKNRFLRNAYYKLKDAMFRY